MADGDAPAKQSDLKVRVLSAIVMVFIAGIALWLGGPVWSAFVAAVALGVIWEWWGLVRQFVTGIPGRIVWMAAALVYVGLAAIMLVVLWNAPAPIGRTILLAIVAAVIGTDVGAYFMGRAIGGPKIAPSISPSKTWAGLGGGMLGAFVAIVTVSYPVEGLSDLGWKLLVAPCLAIVAQAGDFFESWMKRRAGVKDSGKLIPGHGGLFDRADGMLAVLFIVGLISLHSFLGAE